MSTDYDRIRKDNIREYGQGTRHLSFLGRLYTDRTHFVFELLQNAEDAGATRILFSLFDDRLEVTHDGRLFNERDVRGVCGVGEGTKTEDLTQIGKFGIGFKSVYAYTATPEVHSGGEGFRIENYVRPYAVTSKPAGNSWTTLFVFPFNTEEIAPETACKEIGARLRNLSARSLLFLRKIAEIEYKLPDSTGGVYLRDEVARGPARQVSVIGYNNGRDEEETWVIFERPVPLPGEAEDVRVEVSFRLGTEVKNEKKEERIFKIKESPLVVYFPTEKETRFGFLIQGPYRTTPSRDNIPKDDDWNAVLVAETSHLLTEVLPQIKQLGLLTVSFLEALPIRMDDFPEDNMFYPIVASVRKALQNEDFLPADDGSFVSAPNAKLARGADLKKLIGEKQICLLFQSTSTIKWLTGEITQDRTPELRKYLISELDVEEVTPEGFSKKISHSFLTDQTVDWFVKFYSYLSGQEALWRAPRWIDSGGVLRTKPIMKLEDGSLEAPFGPDGKTPKVFLPPEEKTDFPIVGREIFRNEQAADFLNRIGISEPDITDEIVGKILNKYINTNHQSISNDENLKDVEKIVKAFNTVDSSDRQRIINSAIDVPFLSSQEIANKYHKPNNLYLDSPFLKTGLYDFFKNNVEDNENIKYSMNSSYIGIKNIENFAGQIGVIKSLEICEYNATEMQKDYFKKRGRKTGTTIDEDYFINGLHWYRKGSKEYFGLFNLDSEVTLSMSKAIWLTMTSADSKVLTARYRPNDSRRDEEKSKTSFLVDYLKSKKWVPDCSGNFHFPADILIEKLHSDFDCDDRNGWLTAINFGEKAKKSSDEYSLRNNRAQNLGFESVDEAEKMAHLARLLRESGQSSDILFEQFQARSANNQAPFPSRPVANPERRQERLGDQFSDAPEKQYEKRERSVRTTGGAIDPITWLKNQYINESDQMICQICKEEMPFKKRNGEHYFEKKEVLSKKFLSKEHEAQYLALCPLCAAMYEEFVKNDEDTMVELREKLVSTDNCDVPITLGDQETSIRFVETHFHDLKIIVEGSA